MATTTPVAAKLDAIDRRIIAQLQRDSLISNQDLASAIGLSPPACLKRVRHLRETGVITKTVALASPELLGYPQITIIRVKLALPIVTAAQRLEAAMANNPRVLQCMMVAGDYDYVLMVRSRDVGHYHEFARTVLAATEGIQSYTSEIVLSVTKLSTQLPVDL